jgi:hypothetical protein
MWWKSPLPSSILAVVTAIAATLVVPPPALSQQRGQPPVDVALVLAVDVSRSMSLEELRIQRRGYAEAIVSPEVLRAIFGGAHGRIAITIFEWAADRHTREIQPWTLIETAADAQAVSDRLMEEDSRGERRTSISGAIARGIALVEAAPYPSERQVIDVSGDGPNNQGLPVTLERDRAIGKGITINGLPMMTRDGAGMLFGIDDLDEYYRHCVIGGPASFMIPVNGWDQFAEAVRRKLVLEIGGLAPDMPRDPWRRPGAQPARIVPAGYVGGERITPVQLGNEAPYDCMIGEKIWNQRRWIFDGDSR